MLKRQSESVLPSVLMAGVALLSLVICAPGRGVVGWRHGFD